ncbi:hypothetical protein ACVII0_002481 [Sinorhizobium meliloti]
MYIGLTFNVRFLDCAAKIRPTASHPKLDTAKGERTEAYGKMQKQAEWPSRGAKPDSSDRPQLQPLRVHEDHSNKVASWMLVSIPASIMNHNSADLGILTRLR